MGLASDLSKVRGQCVSFFFTTLPLFGSPYTPAGEAALKVWSKWRKDPSLIAPVLFGCQRAEVSSGMPSDGSVVLQKHLSRLKRIRQVGIAHILYQVFNRIPLLKSSQVVMG